MSPTRNPINFAIRCAHTIATCAIRVRGHLELTGIAHITLHILYVRKWEFADPLWNKCVTRFAFEFNEPLRPLAKEIIKWDSPVNVLVVIKVSPEFVLVPGPHHSAPQH